MAISVPIVLKGLGGFAAVAVGATSSYYAYDTFINTGLTKEDKGLLEKVKEFSKFKKENESDNNTTTITLDQTKKVKLVITSNTTDPNFEVKLEISSNDTSSNIVDNLKIWECKIAPKINSHSGKTLSETQINDLKSSFGIDSSTTEEKEFEAHQKNSLSQFIRRCAYLGDRDVKVTESDKKLSREIKLDLEVEASGDNNKVKFSEFEKFFIKKPS